MSIVDKIDARQTWNKSNENASEPREMASVKFTGNATPAANPTLELRPDGNINPSCAAMAHQPHENIKIICSDAISMLIWNDELLMFIFLFYVLWFVCCNFNVKDWTDLICLTDD